tara:strand:+ start:10173 stop:12032 length:1860 start_codon:yes stop_codon:yes gene_type:complete
MRYDIQILRGLSVIAIILYHFDKVRFYNGYLGVDVFFIISGFLITKQILSDLNKRKFSLKNFYKRRVKRILPGYLSAMFLTIFIAVYNLTSEQFFELLRGIKYSLLFLSNIYFSQTINYFSPESERDLIINLWSLSIEEQFYIIYPLFLITVYKYAKKYVFHSIIIALFFSFLFNSENIYEALNFQKLFFNFENYIFYSPFTRAWQLLLGAAIFLIPSNKRIKTISKILLICLLFSLFLNIKIEFYILLLMIVSLIIICNFKINLNYFNKPIIHVGTISYSLYLIHQPVLAGIKNNNYYATPVSYKFINLDTPVNLILTILVIYFLSTINYFFVEQKFRKEESGIKGLLVFILIFIIFLLSIPNIYKITNPNYVEITNDNFELKRGTNYLQGRNNELCITRDSIESACVFGNGEKKLYFLGDSTVASLISGFLNEDMFYSYTMIDYTQAGCLPILGLCDFKYDEQYYIDLVSIKNSIFIMGGNGTYNYLDDQRLLDTLELLMENNNYIYFLGYVPTSSVDEIMYFMKNNKYYSSDNISFHKYQVSRNKDFEDKFNNFYTKVDNSKLEYIDVFEIFCDENLCKFYDEKNVFLLTDYIHFSYTGALSIFESSKFVKLLLNE